MDLKWFYIMLLTGCCMWSFVWGQQEGVERIPGEMIVHIQPRAKASALAADHQAFQGRETNFRVKRVLSKRLGIYLFEFAHFNVKVQSFLTRIREQQHVKTAQLNHSVQLRASNPLNTPNDSLFSEQWNLHNMGQTGGSYDADIDAPQAWTESINGMTGEGDTIVVAVIDAGFDLDHPDLNYWHNHHEIYGNQVDDDGNGYVDDYYGWDAYGNDSTLPEDNHGTHVAGIIGGIGNNGLGVSGINWNVQVMPVTGASSNEAVVVAAYSYVLEQRARYNETNGDSGAFVVVTNSSFGINYADPADYPIWNALYDSLGNYGILNVAATMNVDANVDQEGDMPTASCSDYLLSVTNTNADDQKNSSAAYGDTTIDIGAPGTGIWSTVANGGYDQKTGTSMAAPHVSGAVALLYANACSRLLAQSPDSLTRYMKQIILDHADPISSLSNKTVSNARLNVYKSLRALLEPTADYGFSADGLTVRFQDSSVYAGAYQWSFGDSSFSSRQNPRHTFADTTQYQVCLVAQNPNCQQDTICRSIDIQCGTPRADFAYSDSAGSYQVSFHDSSVSGGGYFWSFGDGAQSTQQNPTHSYSDTGTYQVTQVITSICGTDTVTKAIKVTCNPANADFVSRTRELDLKFTALSEASATYYWDFGDGTSATGQQVSHTYDKDGQYQVCLYTDNTCSQDTSCSMVVASSSTGIQQTSSASYPLSLQVAPNPNNGNFHLHITPSAPVQQTYVRIYNYLGQTVYRQRMGAISTKERLTLQLSDVAAGIYFVSVRTAEHTVIDRFLIQ